MYVKLQPYRQYSVALCNNEKLAPRFFGPFSITQKLSPVAYRLKLLAGSRIHDVFHVSSLGKQLGPNAIATTPLPSLGDNPFSPLLQLKQVLDCLVVQKGKYRPKTKVLIKWLGCPLEDATWENACRLLRSYSSFCLEDKAA